MMLYRRPDICTRIAGRRRASVTTHYTCTRHCRRARVPGAMLACVGPRALWSGTLWITLSGIRRGRYVVYGYVPWGGGMACLPRAVRVDVPRDQASGFMGFKNIRFAWGTRKCIDGFWTKFGLLQANKFLKQVSRCMPDVVRQWSLLYVYSCNHYM